MHEVTRRGLGWCAGWMLAACASGATAQDQHTDAAFEALPPTVRMGIRAEQIRLRASVVPTVVLAPDEASYAQAVASWRYPLLFPVLIDDGTPGARADIARFIRAFEPERVVRWELEPSPLPPNADELARAIDRAVAGVWGQTGLDATPEGLLAFWRGLGHEPVGVVLANPEDPAWTAAIALAAGRAQPIVWHRMRRDFGGTWNATPAWQTDDVLRKALDDRGLDWRGLGTGIDAVTICADAPVRVRLSDGSHLAWTDLLGREPPEGHVFGAARDHEAVSPRWAYVAQVPGSAAQAAYRAMCALFLTPTRAWVYDGYADEAPWNAFSGARAEEMLRGAGLEVVLDRRPATGVNAWSARAGGDGAGLILVNSHGMPEAFDLGPGTARADDVPNLRVPAAVHFVHSWSLGRPGDRATIGRRWLDSGAFAYVGSVQEPYLSAFVPTPTLAARLGARVPWAAAVRIDQSPVWRVATIGDALWTVGPPMARADVRLELEGLRDLDEVLREALGARDLVGACDILAMLGREADVVRLYERAIGQDEIPYDAAALAGVAFSSLARAGGPRLVIHAFGALDEHERTPERIDALWAAAGSSLATADRATVTLLAAHVRNAHLLRDAQALAPALRRTTGAGASEAFLRSLIDRTRDARTRERLEAMADAERSPTPPRRGQRTRPR